MIWTYKDKEFTSEMIGDYVGFVYLITNLTNNRMYIGQKRFKTKKYRMIKKKKKGFIVESDWKKYYGSSKFLQEDFKQLGEEKFKREIIHLCKSKGMMNYLELEEQVLNRVLFKDEYYNAFLGTKIHAKHVNGK